MEQPSAATALNDHEQVPATHCLHCDSRELFWWTNPKGRTVTWFCQSCRTVTTQKVAASKDGQPASTVR